MIKLRIFNAQRIILSAINETVNLHWYILFNALFLESSLSFFSEYVMTKDLQIGDSLKFYNEKTHSLQDMDVQNIEYIRNNSGDIQTVHDLSIDNYHNYFANFLLCHNMNNQSSHTSSIEYKVEWICSDFSSLQLPIHLTFR